MHDESTSCFNIWRTRNADDDDERIALGDWSPSPPVSPSSQSSSVSSNPDAATQDDGAAALPRDDRDRNRDHDYDHDHDNGRNPNCNSSHDHHEDKLQPVPDVNNCFGQPKMTTKSVHSSASAQSSPSVTSPRPMEPWLTAIVLVTFDQDSGPVLDSCIPSDALTQAEKDTVCHHAMPDSATMSSVSVCEDVLYSFRVPRRLNKAEERKGHISVASTRLLLAHALFRQAPDKSKKRGALQKALVLVGSTPIVGLPMLLLTILAPKAFVYGRPVLEHAVQDIDAWPDPRRSATLFQPNAQQSSRDVQKSGNTTILLPIVDDLVSLEWSNAFLTSFAAPIARLYTPETPTNNNNIMIINNSNKRPTNINFNINHLFSPSTPSSISSSPTSLSPAASCFEQRHELVQYHQQQDDDHAVWDVSKRCKHAGASRPTFVRYWALTKPSLRRGASLFHEINPVIALAGVLDQLQALWEILAVGEPLLVVGSTPTACSAAVMALLSLLHPLPFIGDWRPYLCIQDPDYERIVSSRNISDLFPDGCIIGVSNRRMADMMKFPHVLYLPPANAQCLTIGVTAGAGSAVRGRLSSPIRPSMQRSRTIRQMATRVIVAHIRGEYQTAVDAVRAFRLSVYNRITRPFLSVFERYVTPMSPMTANTSPSAKTFASHFNNAHQFLRGAVKKQDAMTEPYALDPFDRPLRLTPFVPSAFPSIDDLNVPRVSTLFRRGASSSWKVRVHSMYQRFIQGPVFREWWHEAIMVADRECSYQHRKHLHDACSRGTSVICHAMKARAHPTEYTDLVTDLASRIQRELVQLRHAQRSLQEGDDVLQEALQRELVYLVEDLPPHKQVLFESTDS